jgi:hypothetical protein
MELVELVMAKTFEMKCLCGTKDVNEAGLQEARKLCPTCKTLPMERVKLAAEATYPWLNK